MEYAMRKKWKSVWFWGCLAFVIPWFVFFLLGNGLLLPDRCAAYYELLVYPFGSAESRCHAPAQQKEAGSAVSDHL